MRCVLFEKQHAILLCIFRATLLHRQIKAAKRIVPEYAFPPKFYVEDDDWPPLHAAVETSDIFTQGHIDRDLFSVVQELDFAQNDYKGTRPRSGSVRKLIKKTKELISGATEGPGEDAAQPSTPNDTPSDEVEPEVKHQGIVSSSCVVNMSFRHEAVAWNTVA